MKMYKLKCIPNCKNCPAGKYAIKINGDENNSIWDALEKFGIFSDWRKSNIQKSCDYFYSYMMNKKALLEEILK